MITERIPGRGGMLSAFMMVLIFLFLPVSGGCRRVPLAHDGFLPAVSFAVPARPEMAAYLGLSPGSGGFFTLDELDAEVVVVDVFQVQCIHCWQDLPLMDELRAAIDAAGYGDRVKVIGIAYGNTAVDVDVFNRIHGPGFPVFADPAGDFIQVERIPACFVLRPRPGGAEVLHATAGSPPPPAKFLSLIIAWGRLE